MDSYRDLCRNSSIYSSINSPRISSSYFFFRTCSRNPLQLLPLLISLNQPVDIFSRNLQYIIQGVILQLFQTFLIKFLKKWARNSQKKKKKLRFRIIKQQFYSNYSDHSITNFFWDTVWCISRNPFSESCEIVSQN